MEATPVSFRPIRRTSVVEQIIDNFSQALIRGDLKPGQRLPSEAELSQQLGVGRAALREAMKMLEVLGVIRIQQGEGTFIEDAPSPSLLNPLVFAIMLETKVADQLVEFRSFVQSGYSQLASKKATPDDWDRIEGAAQACESYARRPGLDVEQLAQLDLEFHYAVLDATHNPLVIKIGRVTEELFSASIRTTLSTAEGVDFALETHRRLAEALRSADSRVIYQTITSDLTSWGRQLMEGGGEESESI